MIAATIIIPLSYQIHRNYIVHSMHTCISARTTHKIRELALTTRESTIVSMLGTVGS